MKRVVIFTTVVSMFITAAAAQKAPAKAEAAAQKSPTKKAAEPAKESAKPFRISNPDSMFKPTNGYSMVAEVPLGNGAKMVYIAGQVAMDKSGNLVGKDDFRAQVEQVFANLKAAVESAGGEFHDVIKLNYYCAESVDPSQVPLMRELRDKYVNTTSPPTSTFVFVKRLIRPEWMIEVEAVAVVKKK